MNAYSPKLAYLVFIAMYLTGCAAGPTIGDGQVVSLYHGTAEWIIDGCLRGECASHMFVKDQLVVYARPLVENVAFVITSKGVPVDKLNGLSGNLVSCSTWHEFYEWMLNNGFQLVTAATPAYQTILGVGASIASMELLPIFSIVLTPAELPEWVAPETRSE